jgi:multisubunit Na+/H+ antiporter MnhB subunit
MGLILTLILIMLLLGALPAYPYSRSWGYGPSGLAGALLVVLVVLLLMGTVPWGFGPNTVVVP